jgi:hypothetical protein
MKKLIPLLVILAAVVIVLGVAKNVIAKAAIESGVRLMTGLTLSVNHMDVSLLHSAVGIRGLTLHNPAGFPDPVMADLPEIYVDYDLGAFLGGAVHLETVRLNLREFTVVRDRSSALNLDALNVVQESKAAKTGKTAAAKRPVAPQIRIDALELRIGKVVYKDYTGGGAPRVQEFVVNVHERYEHITNPYVLGGIVVSRALMKTTIAQLANFDLGGLQSLAHGQLQHAQRLVGDAVTAAQHLPAQAVKQLTDPAALAGTAKSTAEGVLKKLLPPGSSTDK